MGRQKEFDQTRALDKAMELFWCQGYQATSIQDLVARTGVNRQSLYDTFGDKHALYLAALDRYAATSAPPVCALLTHPGPVKSALRELFERVADDAVSDPSHRGCMMVNAAVELAPHDAAAAERVRTNAMKMEALFEEAIARGQQSGEIASQQPARALARFLFSSLQGLRVTAKVNPDREALREVIETILTSVA